MILRHLSAALLLPLALHAAEPRPNFLVLLADDLGYGDLACFGHPEIQTPHLDRLAAEGLKLTACYAAAAVCSPARAGLLTGRTPYRAGIYNAIPFLSPAHLRASEVTIAALLKGAGYATAQAGKWHLNGFFNLPGQPQPGDHGFDHWFAVQNNALPNHLNPFNFVRNGIPLGPQRGYSGAIVAAEAVRWLESGRDRAKPFFLYVALHEPHEPIMTDPAFAERYRARHPDDPSRVAYYGNVTQMDAAVGRILAALDSQGLAADTVVVFTSDNGPARTRYHNAGSSGGFREYKGHLYEGGIRVPGIVRWPRGVRAGSVSDTPVSGVDFLPTFCELARVAPPAGRPLDGTSLAALFGGGEINRSQPLYWQYHWSPGSSPQVALRDRAWKLLARHDAPRPRAGDHNQSHILALRTAPLTGFELYDLKRDPAEKTNLAASEPARLAELREKLEQFHASVRAEAPLWPSWEDPGYEAKTIVWPTYQPQPLAK
ncbi:MAG: sulfatase-like hydrolase/transferase [Opitutaceae bacterium]|nr:sulfatase-like hydrolase/transferase [Opitutaceae bacterium]